ncbi:unnamed protein product [Spirodela intermedia]|uniref:Uncharacterized protein n=1 Tax=Spirodela intermedia TaxID=51605 RepID=A0A7I8IAR8_SPIIN|nr:unnamed protein product [Spirodela intermedia]CAA6654789.1 unnamed protein product [Spirodela intermedia]
MIRTSSKVTMVSSSPARMEKLPAPPLARLLRGVSGSRSRGRSSSSSVARSSPLFMAKAVSAQAVDLRDQKEPSSPRSPASARSKQGDFVCNPFSGRMKTMFGLGPAPSSAARRRRPARGWCRWFLLPHPGCYRRREETQQELLQQQQLLKEGGPGVGPAEAEHEGEKGEVFASATPPKNALLLMRCRSAPHRPSAAATTFPNKLWASPSMAEGPPPSGMGTKEPVDSFPVKADGEPREREGEDEDAAAAAAAVGPSPSFSSRPLILSRCKSEPAWRAAKLSALEAHNSFWNAAIATRLTAPRASTAARTG